MISHSAYSVAPPLLLIIQEYIFMLNFFRIQFMQFNAYNTCTAHLYVCRLAHISAFRQNDAGSLFRLHTYVGTLALNM